jgi:colanic acid/amylovoran biosynthesis glycosyltransferase
LKGGYHLIHVYFGNVANRFLFLKDLLRVPLVTSFHGSDVTKYPDMWGAAIYDDLRRRGDLFLPVSGHLCQRLLALGFPPPRVQLHRVGVDLDHFKPKDWSARPSTAGPVILTVARLVEIKGLTYALEAFAEVRRRFPQARYRIVGDGPQRDRLKQLAIELGIADAVEFLGWQNWDEVRRLYQAADLFLLPSDEEGLPKAVVEAQATGLPVVGTLHSGISEAVQDGVTGLLVPERDAQALAEALLRLLANPQMWPEMGRQGRAFVLEHLDVRKQTRRLADLYAALASGERIAS